MGPGSLDKFQDVSLCSVWRLKRVLYSSSLNSLHSSAMLLRNIGVIFFCDFSVWFFCDFFCDFCYLSTVGENNRSSDLEVVAFQGWVKWFTILPTLSQLWVGHKPVWDWLKSREFYKTAFSVHTSYLLELETFRSFQALLCIKEGFTWKWRLSMNNMTPGARVWKHEKSWHLQEFAMLDLCLLGWGYLNSRNQPTLIKTNGLPSVYISF